MKNNKNADATYSHSKQRFYDFVERYPLELKIIDRQLVEQAAQEHPLNKQFKQSIEQQSVNYLRHQCSSYDSLIRKLSELCSSDQDRHILHVERRSLVALAKIRILDKIAAAYSWLENECSRQRDVLEDNVGDYIIPFGPHKGVRLQELDNDYLIRLLGMGTVRKQLRTRVERVLANKMSKHAHGTAPERNRDEEVDARKESRQRFLKLINQHLGLEEPLAIELDRKICDLVVEAFEEYPFVMEECDDGLGCGRSSWKLCNIEDEDGEPICEEASSFGELCKRFTGNTDQSEGVALFETVGDYLFEEIEHLISEYAVLVTACEGERFDDDHTFCFASDLVGKYFSEFGPLSCEEIRLRHEPPFEGGLA